MSGIYLVLIAFAIAFAFLFFLFRMIRYAERETISILRDSVEIVWGAIYDERVYSHLPKRKINAIKFYQELTGAGFSEAKYAIEVVIEHWDHLDEFARTKRKPQFDLGDDTGIRDLVKAGQVEEAVEIYRRFTGVDLFSAQDAITTIQQEIQSNRQVSTF